MIKSLAASVGVWLIIAPVFPFVMGHVCCEWVLERSWVAWLMRKADALDEWQGR